MPVHLLVTTKLGDLILVSQEDALTGVYHPGQAHFPDEETLGEPGESPVLDAATQQLQEYFEGARTEFDLPLNPPGKEFDQQVWEILLTIEFGQTMTYGEIARELGNPKLAQRVGQAVGHNPISIIIPCHRVIGADGSLTGYAGGLARKRTLLEIENPVDTLF